MNAIERAFELARDGDCNSVLAIRKKLVREAYAHVDEHLAGSSIRTQLSQIIRRRSAARTE